MQNKALLFILLFPVYLSAQHGAFISPVVKYTSVNSQSAAIYGVKAGWIINKTFVIGGAFYSLGTKTEQPWVDPVANNTPYLWFNTGGLNFEYFVLRHEPLSLSLELFLGGSAVKLRARDESRPFTDMYGGDFLLFEPQINANYDFNEWLHLSLGISYRHASGFNKYPNLDSPGTGFITIKDLSGPAASLSLVFGMY